MMLSEDKWQRARRSKRNRFFFLIFASFAGLMFLLNWWENVMQVSKCESLRKQGVKAYVAEAMLSKECVVLHRDVSMDEK